MTGNPAPSQLAPAIQAILADLRRRIRRYVGLEGLAAAIAWLGAAFWISLGTDWAFEPSRPVRGILLLLLLLILAAIIFRSIIVRVLVPLSNRSMAVLLERYFPQFHDGLITAVELTERESGATDCDRSMLARTCREAVAPIAAVRLRQVFDPRPLRRALLAAVVAAVSVAVYGLMNPQLMAIWADRCLALGSAPWPRATQLALGEPFGPENMVIRVAKGSDVDVVVLADLTEHIAPQVVQIRSRTEGGVREQKAMNRDGLADPQRDDFQSYSHKFQGVLAPITFDVVGGDDALRGRRIEVVDSPTVVAMWLDLVYPKYTVIAPRTVPVAGLMQVPVGTHVTVRAKANKALARVTIESASERMSQPAEVVEPADTSQAEFFQYTLGALGKDNSLQFTLLDADGIKSREPIRLTLAALEDRRPEFAVQLKGIGSAITPQASIPVAGRVSDDYGIARVWFEYEVDKNRPGQRPIASLSGKPTEVTDLPIDQALDVRDLGLKAGQKFQLCLAAQDRYDLTPHPNIGTSDRWLLDVVTADQLRTMLQARELVLRQRFEAILREMVETRDSLARIEYAATPVKSKTAGKGAEPGDKPQAEDRTPERLQSQRALRAQGAGQNSRKDAQETLGIAQAFDDIRAELVNNRIDTEELKIRLQTRIADPLRKIGDEMFPQLDRCLDQLELALDDAAKGVQSRNLAVAQVDRILAAMRQVLGSMIELEDFNEAIDLLRSIIRSQEKVNDLTKKRQKQKLRDLLEK
jgi:hypothetical protein